MRKVMKQRKRRRREENSKGEEKKGRQGGSKKRDTEVLFDERTRHGTVLTCLPLINHEAPHPRKVPRSG